MLGWRFVGGVLLGTTIANVFGTRDSAILFEVGMCFGVFILEHEAYHRVKKITDQWRNFLKMCEKAAMSNGEEKR